MLTTWEGTIQFWDLESDRQIAALRACDHKQVGGQHAAFLDENTLVSVFDGELRIWRAPSWEEIERDEARANLSHSEAK